MEVHLINSGERVIKHYFSKESDGEEETGGPTASSEKGVFERTRKLLI